MKNYFGAPIKKLGFGFMRLPTLPGKPDSEIDIEQVKKMVDLYLERGFTYFDTAFVYHGGKSEEAIREAVSKRYARDKFQVTTKLPLWNPNVTLDEMKGMTQTSLDRAGIDFYDLYFLHGIGPGREEMLDKIKAWDYLQSVKDTGKAKNIGFSYHGDGDTLNKILDAHAKDIDIIQLQINYLDWEDEGVQSKKCYDAAVAHGVGVIVMEPVKGGSLANFTPAVSDIFKKANPDASLASWALRFPQGLDGVITVLSGMSNVEQVDDNTKTTDNAGPLNDAEKKVIANALEELKKVPTIPCTACRYCVDDCPKSINTPGIIGILNDYAKYQNLAGAKRSYGMTTGGGPMPGAVAAKSSDCIECGSCENHCPQHIKIIETHKEAVKLFE
ncbi:MAG: aldo/keto reductase [Oscillospiraceae bacterium]|jgi:predicted aldo/keto reductase-like oxidoreductase|nr:aldo/keto reductase [Oscillospiraceae bacterium]